jgi:ribosome-binding ATPase YchF (GTP1/OBG family)
MERFGLVGLPNAGKSSLYNALTGGGALAAPYPFATKDPNIGVAKVPDTRLDQLAAMSKSKNVVHAAVQVVDIGGSSRGEQGRGVSATSSSRTSARSRRRCSCCAPSRIRT